MTLLFSKEREEPYGYKVITTAERYMSKLVDILPDAAVCFTLRTVRGADYKISIK